MEEENCEELHLWDTQFSVFRRAGEDEVTLGARKPEVEQKGIQLISGKRAVLVLISPELQIE